MPTKFDFVSPGVQLTEIDQSIISPSQEADGIVLIGQAKQGPSMKVVKVSTLQDFVDVFGKPSDGVKNDDPWRMGNTGAPTYAGYAAQAYLASGVGPVKFVRLGGIGETVGDAGWSFPDCGYSFGTPTDFSGAIGLFVANSGSGLQEAVLGAILYVSGAGAGLLGTTLEGSTLTTPASTTFVKATGSNNQFNLQFSNSSGVSAFNIDFNKNSQNFLRKVLNTDPTLASVGVGNTSLKYFLGETFENQVSQLSGFNTANGLVGFLCGLNIGGKLSTAFTADLTPSKTGWFFGQKPAQKKLFRLEALDDGEQFQKTYFVRIKDLSPSTATKPDATFTLEIVKYGESRATETFSNLTFNSQSPNYISKKIGDLKQTWNSSQKKFDISGKFNNSSSLVRVAEVGNELNRSDLPLGFVGPKRPIIANVSGSNTNSAFEWLLGADTLPFGGNPSLLVSGASLINYTASIAYPTHVLSTANNELSNTGYFGLSLDSQKGYDMTIGDVGILKDALSEMDLDLGDPLTDASYVFTLEQLTSSATAGKFYFDQTNVAPIPLADVLNVHKIKQFAAPFFGGFDGNNVLVSNPYNSERITNGTYERHTIEQALDIVSDKDLIRYDLISMPGIIDSGLINKLISQTDSRGDALAIVDLQGIAQSAEDTGGSSSSASISSTITYVNDQVIDSSYVASYYPNIRLQDTLNGNGTIMIAPPSIAAIGAIASSEASSQPWFAPAGFNRGGLSTLGGAGGPKVVGTVEHLTKDERDSLYEASINPIARFPATGDTVIFGQKTMQQANSALDRINVRRMMIFLKKQIGDIADTILFDNNVNSTWERFKSKAQPVLAQLQTQFGISEYKLVLDETTTTADLVDRNIMYAKVYVKPARAIEFIAIDFVITQTGVEF